MLIVGALFLIPQRASANPTARLVYIRNKGAESCPDEEALKSAVAARLGYEPFRPFADVTVIARVKRSDRVYRGEVELTGGSGIELGSREIDATDHCEDVVKAMALTVSILVDPLSLKRPPPAVIESAPPEEPPPPSPVAPSPEPVAPTPPPPSTEPSGAVEQGAPRFFAGAGVLGAAGLAPAPSLSGALFFGVQFARWGSMALEGRADLPAGTDRAEGHVSSHTYVGSAVPCLHVRPFAVCAVASLGLLSASSSGIASPRSDRAFYASVGPRLAVDLALTSWLTLRPSLELGVPLSVRPLAVDGAIVYDYPSVWGGIGIGLLVDF